MQVFFDIVAYLLIALYITFYIKNKFFKPNPHITFKRTQNKNETNNVRYAAVSAEQYNQLKAQSSELEYLKANWPAIEKGMAEDDPKMTYYASHAYLIGVEGKRDLEKSQFLLEKAASLQYPNALYKLGMQYLEGGNNTEKNMEKAFHFLKQAADLNFPNAFYNLACIYLMGDACPQDKNLALMWFKKCADLGDPDAQVNVENIEKELFEEQEQIIRETYNKERKDLLNYKEAKDQLPLFEALGSNRFKDPQVVKELNSTSWDEIQKGVEANIPKQVFLAALAYFNGIHVEQNIPLSVLYFKKAAEMNYILAYHKLGMLYLYGCGVPQDIEMAWDWLEKAGEKGHAFSQTVTLQLGLKRQEEREKNQLK